MISDPLVLPHLPAARVFYASMLREFKPETALGLTIAYILRKVPQLSFPTAEAQLRPVLCPNKTE